MRTLAVGQIGNLRAGCSPAPPSLARKLRRDSGGTGLATPAARVIPLPGDSCRVLQHSCSLRRVPKADQTFRARPPDAGLVQHVERVQVHAQFYPLGDRYRLVDAVTQIRDP